MYLVTGGAGFIGSHLVERLAEKGDVRVLDNLSTGKRSNLPEGVELVEGDVQDAKHVEKAMPGVDTIFHLAAQTSVIKSIEEPVPDFQSNVMGTLNVLNEARKATAP